MQWYWWALIVVAVLAFIPLKMKITKAFIQNQKEKQEKKAKLLEEDE